MTSGEILILASHAVRGMSTTDAHVLLTLAGYVNERGEAFPSQATLAWAAGMSERTIRRTLDRIELAGWVSVRRRGPTSSIYTLSIAKLTSEAERSRAEEKQRREDRIEDPISRPDTGSDLEGRPDTGSGHDRIVGPQDRTQDPPRPDTGSAKGPTEGSKEGPPQGPSARAEGGLGFSFTELRAAYTSGLEAACGGSIVPQRWGDAEEALRALVSVAGYEEPLEYLREIAGDFFRAVPENERRYQRGFHPTKAVEWLNNGKPGLKVRQPSLAELESFYAGEPIPPPPPRKLIDTTGPNEFLKMVPARVREQWERDDLARKAGST